MYNITHLNSHSNCKCICMCIYFNNNNTIKHILNIRIRNAITISNAYVKYT